MIKNFSELKIQLQQSGQKRRIAAVCVNDEATRGALEEAAGAGLAEAIYVDDENPQDDVALGCCMIASSDRLMTRFEQSGCLIEI